MIVDELLAHATSRSPFRPDDGLSGAPMERITIGGERYVAKWMSRELDWIMRALDDWGCRPRGVWETGLLDRLPACIDHTIVAVAHDEAGRMTVLLMRDVADHLVPAGTAVLPLAQHRRFLTHMAALHVEFWGHPDSSVLCPLPTRYSALSPRTGEQEIRRGSPSPVPAALPAGWRRLVEVSPEAGERALALATDPTPLVEAMEETPQTLVHGDWKAGNLGSHPDGRTILLDWAWPGRAAPCADLAWYLAVNCDRLPESKQDAVAAYRRALENLGITTADWWERQVELAVLGAFVQLGWSKADQPAELAWWVERALPVARELL